ncbi:MAG: hypothetical protein EOO61_01320 [Hymenobacter sp.]|nr:MAG: hypothetical protein EOO61_01320 [Hymenobacter sp.]
MVTTTTTLNAFAQAGNKERAYIAWFLRKLGVAPEDIHHSPATSYITVDTIFVWEGRWCVLEAKVRDMEMDRYPNHIIERKKANQLKKYYQVKGYHPYYINFFESMPGVYDGVILYDLKSRFDEEPNRTGTYDEPVFNWSMGAGRTNTVAGGGTVDKAMCNLTRSRSEWGDLAFDATNKQVPDPS